MLHYKQNVLSNREHHCGVTHVFRMCADVVRRFRIVGALRQPLLYCVAVGRRMVVYAAFETANTWHIKCTRRRLKAHIYTTTVPRFSKSFTVAGPHLWNLSCYVNLKVSPWSSASLYRHEVWQWRWVEVAAAESIVIMAGSRLSSTVNHWPVCLSQKGQFLTMLLSMKC